MSPYTKTPWSTDRQGAIRIHPDSLRNRSRLVQNIKRTYLEAIETLSESELDSARFWYYLAREECQKIAKWYDLPRNVIAGVFAITSPGTSWAKQLEQVPKFVRAFAEGKEMPSIAGYARNSSKAWQLLSTRNSKLVSGPKVRRFYANLIGVSKVVTVDRHAARVALRIRETGPVQFTDNGYRLIESAYRRAAELLNIPASELQSVTWEYWRAHAS